MKITIVTGPFGCIPPNALGAVEKLWYLMGLEWKRRGSRVCHISKSPKENDVLEESNIYINGYDRTGSWVKDLLLDFVYSYKALDQAPKSDVVILNTIWSPILYPLFKKKLGISLYNVARFPKKQLSFYNSVDILSCVSTPVYKAAVEQSPKITAKTCVISNPIDTKIFTADKPRQCSTTPNVSYTGRIHTEKGLDLLVKAIEILNHKGLKVNLSLIGPRDIPNGGSGMEYVEMLNSLAHSFSINWVDPIYKPELLAEELKKSDIFCYPSVAELGETFGVSPLEAMGLGLPTVVSGLLCFGDFLEDNVSGLVFDHKAKDAHMILAKKIESLIESPELYKHMSLNAIESSKRFSVEAIATQYMRKFQEVISKK